MKPGKLVTCAGWLSLAAMLAFSGSGIRIERVGATTPDAKPVAAAVGLPTAR